MKRISVVAILVLGACASAPRPGEPLHASVQGDALVHRGERIFMSTCESCHPGGSAGVGPEIVRSSPLPNARIRFQVRNGIGEMPAFSEHAIPEDDLDALIAYIDALEETARSK